MGDVLFKRSARLTLDTIQITGGSGGPKDGLDIAFKIEKDLKPEPNKAEVTVANLNPAHRRQLQELKEGAAVELLAGYGSRIGRIFLGDMRYVYSTRDKATWMTTARAATGDTVNGKRVNKSYATPMTVKAVIVDMAKSLGVGLGNALAAIGKAEYRAGATQFVNGTIVSGQAHVEFARLLKQAGLEHSIQDGALQVLKLGEALDATAVVVSQANGMTESPEISSSGILKCRTLLQADIFPGRKIMVRSDSFPKGAFFRVEKATYLGDSFAKDWFVDVEARAL